MAEANVGQTKVCSKCGVEKPRDGFSPDRRAKSGLQSQCKACAAAKTREWLAANRELDRERQRQRRAANPELGRQRAKEYRKANPEKVAAGQARWRKQKAAQIRAQKAEWRERNRENERKRQAARREAKREEIKAYNAEWRERNLDRLREQARDWQRTRRLARPAHRINCRMRAAIGLALRGGKAGQRWQELVGYTLDDLVSHIERQFCRGMSWANIGKWHIDHIVPLSAFRFESADDPDFRAAWALTNLRPLWARENLSKNDRRVLLL